MNLCQNSSWEEEKIKTLFIERVEKNINSNKDYLSIVKDVGVVPYSEKGNVGNKTSDNPENYKMVYPDDLVINPMNIKIGSVGISRYSGCLSNVYMVLKPKKNLIPNFYGYLFELKPFQRSLRKISTGIMEIRESINKIEFYSLRLPYPPLYEQKQIVEFLDTKTELIDSLIEKTESKIELLKEKRTSLINETVTKGLNPNVDMKDSGMEWIREIPIHWETSKLGFYTTKIGSGSTPRGGSEVYVDSGIPFIRSQNVHFDGLRIDGISFIKDEVHHSMKGSTVVKNDILLNITGGSIGRCCVVKIDREMNVNQHVSIIRTTNKLKNLFLNFILSCDLGQSQVKFNMSGGNREGLTIEGIRDFQITLPPINEQQQIVEYLDEQTGIIDKTISNEEKRIELLKEYRQSLISEVVTGKRKVTN